MTEPLSLTDLNGAAPSLRHKAHGYVTSGRSKRLGRRIFGVAKEVLAALPRDLIKAIRRVRPGFVRLESGEIAEKDVSRLALYVHYSASGRVSDLVLFQLNLLRQCGFAIVFISMAAQITQDDWQAVRQHCRLVVQRRNFGQDFGAWRDVMPEIARRWPPPDELMLVNDSVLGPIRDLSPIIEAMREGGKGLFGLTESHQVRPHLQSYMLLARGRDTVADLMLFIGSAHISHSKWLLVQMTEIRLARWMLQRGHRVAAVFGYDRLVSAAASDPVECAFLEASHARLKGLSNMPVDQAAALLHAWPLNPTHHMWHLLISRFDFPFLKTELVLRNPGRLPRVADWPTLVPPDSPCALPVLLAHIETMRSERPASAPSVGSMPA